ncbi:hypothetical protein PAXRUDRAFT_21604 [Paxillus rubicundulus Ve08.2h10]|uniref:Uncharacterized protein n=1 Tax=Paxillus rubicundulus Ve08.2h10 TaxID=930991 RepID=A0A0D0CB60_9AGAM|nr:hypothetical protein PAXRUDRAFT_21604 [Paxillus rubicundulus Ve08.2h10]
MHSLPASKTCLQLILANQATLGGVEGPNPSPGTSKGSIPRPFPRPTRRSSQATSKALVTPSKQAPSLGPGPSTSKKAKASVSKSRLKTPLVAQKAKFSIDVGPTPTDSIKVNHPLAGSPP